MVEFIIAVLALVVGILSIPAERLQSVSDWWRRWRKRLLIGSLGLFVFLVCLTIWASYRIWRSYLAGVRRAWRDRIPPGPSGRPNVALEESMIAMRCLEVRRFDAGLSCPIPDGRNARYGSGPVIP
jgi:hypothetical protein